MRKSPRRKPLLLIVLLAAAAFHLAACAGTPSPSQTSQDRSLSFSVKSRADGIAATVSDTRAGRHTVWVVLLNPPKGVYSEVFAAINNGTGGSGTVGSNVLLPPGTYRYAVYDADGNPQGDPAEYWTPERQVGSGKVSVP